MFELRRFTSNLVIFVHVHGVHQLAENIYSISITSNRVLTNTSQF